MQSPLVFRFALCYQAEREAHLRPAEHHAETLARGCEAVKHDETRKHHSVVLVKGAQSFVYTLGIRMPTTHAGGSKW